MLSTSTMTARSISATRRATLSTDDALRVVHSYMLLHHSEDQLDQMSSTEVAREAAAKQVIPDAEVVLNNDQTRLIEQLRCFSPNLGCWRSLVREVLSERQRFNMASA